MIHLNLSISRLHMGTLVTEAGIVIVASISLIARMMGPTWAPLGPTGPRWAQCWPHELCYLGLLIPAWDTCFSHQSPHIFYAKFCLLVEIMYLPGIVVFGGGAVNGACDASRAIMCVGTHTESSGIAGRPNTCKYVSNHVYTMYWPVVYLKH